MAPSISTTQHSYTLAGLLSSPTHRLDDRALLAFRPLHISTDIAPQAAGSAQCLLGGTKCIVVVSAEVTDGQEANEPHLSCEVDCPMSIPQGTNMTSLLLTLQKTLSSALNSSAIPQEQFVVLRSPLPPFQPTKSWSIHLDVTFANIQGGNLADVMFAAAWAALNSIRLPRTRAIGFDTDLLNNNRQSEGNLDSFDIKGTLAKTRGAASGADNKNVPTSLSERDVANLDPLIKSKTGVDFEVMDLWDGGSSIQGSRDFPVAVTVNLLSEGILLDATLTEEACFPTSRRLLVLCSPSSGKIASVQMINATLDVGISGTGEDTIKAAGKILGTADYKRIIQATVNGQEYARGLYGAIQSQMASTKDTTMQVGM